MLASLATLAYLATSAASHAVFQAMWVNDVDQGSWCVRMPQNNNPVNRFLIDDIACNANATRSSGLCAVMPSTAGDSVTVEMHQEIGDRSCANLAIPSDHLGPIQAYMAKVDNAATVEGSSADWFKITEAGLLSNNPEYWATQVLNDNCGHFTFTVPDIAQGQYLLRAEAIGLEIAGAGNDGAEFYISCFQLDVGGTGTHLDSPPTVKLPGAYTAEDPGLLIDIWTSPTAYAIPGPTPFGTTSPAVATTPWPTTATWDTNSQPATIPTTAPPGGISVSLPLATSVPSSTPTGPANGAPLYGQCGGQGFTGPTVCKEGICTRLNQFFSQCL
ncbi:hypothetical protein EIP91_012145 [Steccherinum ochraceum]|uniref:AA9 family lytic polysaccharide monooxygenase n=1 Tax=Steccherinum ochraceum TaxID=92696 RepID=A0A4R0RWG1_9APHY|nr:hypothetical protein EIP91_012145 [Steccherinum ochraceum]